MPQVSPSRLIGELSFPQIPELLRKASVLCLPIGSIEQHGPHLPLNTDVILAEAVTKSIISRWGESLDLWQLPVVSISLAREHEWAPGTLSLSLEGMISLLRDLGRELARAFPARNLAIVNAHGGNKGVLEAFAQDLRADFGFNLCILNLTALNGHADYDMHAGKTETSMMLAVAPELVHVDRVSQLKTPPARDVVLKTILLDGVSWPWTSNDERIADFGVVGDPTTASAELGRQLIAHVVEAAGTILRGLLDNQG